MIYQLRKYLETQLPGITFYVDGLTPDSKQNHVMLTETPGAVRGVPDNRRDPAVQVLSRHLSQFSARTAAESVFDVLRERHNFDLPVAITGDAVLRVARVSALQQPTFFGKDNTYVYVCNYVFTFADPAL